MRNCVLFMASTRGFQIEFSMGNDIQKVSRGSAADGEPSIQSVKCILRLLSQYMLSEAYQS